MDTEITYADLNTDDDILGLEAQQQVEAFIPHSLQDEQVNAVFLRLKKNLTQEQIENLEKVARGIVGENKYRD